MEKSFSAAKENCEMFVHFYCRIFGYYTKSDKQSGKKELDKMKRIDQLNSISV